MDHLLYLGRGAGGGGGAESEELQVACLMGLVSFLASIPEVQQIAPLDVPQLSNAVAGAIVQSGNIIDKPFTDAGLDGSGEVIQIVDTGLDTTSCFFADAGGEQVEHGRYFEIVPSDNLTGGPDELVFSGGSFPVDLTQRKVVQYTRLVLYDDESQEYCNSVVTPLYSSTTPWFSSPDYGDDMYEGHGTHTAGSAAGATLNSPANVSFCDIGKELGCVGGCLTSSQADYLPVNGWLDLDTLCPMHGCDGLNGPCLSDDVAKTLEDNGGIARGAKLSIFDGSVDGRSIDAYFALNGVWESTEETGCAVHSNSWGGNSFFSTKYLTMEYDSYMYQNPEHLLLFAAGNSGNYNRTFCTNDAPGIGKNVLSIGATSSGPTRWSNTSDDGDEISSSGDEIADIDTVAFFSSYGLTTDDRIKPELVAPGTQVLSAKSDGTEEHTFKLTASSGTSMVTPIVAGAAVMIRQYFKDETFYAYDVNERGFCGYRTNVDVTNAFVCKEFTPAAVTLKAMLVNSADLMGGESEPNGERGFGRVHLEAGLPLSGLGDMGLFVLDAFDTAIEEYTVQEYSLEIIPDTGVELRATFAWIDPTVDLTASTQLLNDLDLTVVAPDGTLYRMFSDADSVNVIEHVVVSSDVLEVSCGVWTVSVSCFGLTTDTQAYSLVVTGPIAEGSGEPSSRSVEA